MSSKGVSKTLWIVITAVIVLIVALILITMFGGVISRFGSVTDATQFCKLSGKNTCNAAGSLPFDWEMTTITITGQDATSCKALLSNCDICPPKQGTAPTDKTPCPF